MRSGLPLLSRETIAEAVMAYDGFEEERKRI